MTAQVEKAAQRQQPRLRRGKPAQAIMEQNCLLSLQPALFDVEPDMVESVRQDRMLAPLRIDRDREPRRKLVDAEAIAIGWICGLGSNAERPRVEIGMPNEPRLRGREVGMFRESAAPRAWRRRSRASRSWRACTSRRSRDRGAAIPTSAPRDRCRARRHRAPDHANRTPCRGIHPASRAAPAPARRCMPILPGRNHGTAWRAIAAICRQAGFALQLTVICQFHYKTRRVTA